MTLENMQGADKFIDDFVNTNPVGANDLVSSLDDHIRGIKNILLNTFPNVNGAVTASDEELNKVVGLTASSSELNILGGVTGVSSTDIDRLASIAGNGALDAFPANTLMTFQQTAAPTGWVKETTHDDKSFRVVSGAAASGGTSDFLTVFGLQATAIHTLLEAEIPTHNHESAGGHVHTTQYVSGGGDSSYSGVNVSFATSRENTNTSSQYKGTAGAHTHTAFGGATPDHSHGIELRVKYVDLIIAKKS